MIMAMRSAKCRVQTVDRRRRLGLVSVLLVAFCIPAVTSVSATVLLPADFTTVVAESVTIVHGRVVDVTSGLTGPRRSIIVSTARMAELPPQHGCMPSGSSATCARRRATSLARFTFSSALLIAISNAASPSPSGS